MLVKMLQFICPDEFYGFWVQSVRASLKSTRIFLTLCVLHLGKSSTLRRILLAISVIYELCMQGKKAKKLTVNDLSRRSGVGLEFLQSKGFSTFNGIFRITDGAQLTRRAAFLSASLKKSQNQNSVTKTKHNKATSRCEVRNFVNKVNETSQYAVKERKSL